MRNGPKRTELRCVEDADFFARYVPKKATVRGLATHTQDWTCIVDSGASIRMLEYPLCLPKEKMTIRRSEHIMDILNANVFVDSVLKAKVHIEELGFNLWLLVEESPSVLSLGRLCNELGYFYGLRDILRNLKGSKVIECDIESFVPVVAVTRQRVAPARVNHTS